MSNVDNPLKWLLAALPDYVPAHLLPVLMRTYEVNKAAYYRAVKIRDLERRISVYARRNNPQDALSLAKWREKLARLKENQL